MIRVSKDYITRRRELVEAARELFLTKEANALEKFQLVFETSKK